MAQPVKALTGKHGGLTSTPGTHIMEGEKTLTQAVSFPQVCHVTSMRVCIPQMHMHHTCTHLKKLNMY